MEANLSLMYVISLFSVLIAFAFAAYLFLWVRRQKSTNARINEVAALIKEGAQVYVIDDAELERVSTDGKQETRTLVLHVTDPELLARTGGIVQGMSGCPILQDGKLVGAVTHVFVDDATRGYGIFAETMLENLNEN